MLGGSEVSHVFNLTLIFRIQDSEETLRFPRNLRRPSFSYDDTARCRDVLWPEECWSFGTEKGLVLYVFRVRGSFLVTPLQSHKPITQARTCIDLTLSESLYAVGSWPSSIYHSDNKAIVAVNAKRQWLGSSADNCYSQGGVALNFVFYKNLCNFII